MATEEITLTGTTMTTPANKKRNEFGNHKARNGTNSGASFFRGFPGF
jgi:hypothetical protein